MNYFLVFLAMFVTDVCWTFYLLNVEGRKSIAAGLWAMALYVFGAFVVSSYVDNKLLIIAAAFGSFAGTYVTIEYKKWKEKQKKLAEQDKKHIEKYFNDHPPVWLDNELTRQEC